MISLILAFDKINLSINGSYFWAVLLCIIGAAYSIYIYKNSLPLLSKFSRILLNSLRIISLIAIILFLYEPILRLISSNSQNPVHYFFIDKSLSITKNSAGKEKSKIISEILYSLKDSKNKSDYSFFTFDKEVHPSNIDSADKLPFSGSATNFSNIFQTISSAKVKPQFISIISDGIQNEGSGVETVIENLGIPVLTLALGDTATKKDISINSITANEFIYPNIASQLRVSVINSNFGKVECPVTLSEDGRVISKSKIVFNDGSNSINLEYKPVSIGEKHLQVKIEVPKDDSNSGNNTKSIFIKVNSNKRKAVIIAGSPSPDITFIKQSLSADTNISTTNIIEISSNTTLSPVSKATLDSASVLILLHFPTVNSSKEIVQLIKSEITDKNKSFLIFIDENTSYDLLSGIQNFLPVKSGKRLNGSTNAQPLINDKFSSHAIFSNSNLTSQKEWDEFAPVSISNNEFITKPEAIQLLSAKIGNTATTIPLLSVSSVGSRRSAAFMCSDIWRWKLSSKSQFSSKFDQLIQTIYKWLFAASQKDRFLLRTNKQFYSANEKIDFAAELYDESFEPVSNAQVSVEISGKSVKQQALLNSLGNGFYEGAVTISDTGDFFFKGSVQNITAKVIQPSGKFNVGENNIELVNLRTDAEYMKRISALSGGQYFYQDAASEYLKQIENLNSENVTIKTTTNEFVLWNSTWSMIILILLFAVEWFLRKRFGML